ncbi:ABC transporter substrate-binding protein [Metabacillus halosaccharovorans]|uniref:ABC transporter substrate-binding protein n=2 Tax=Metabacillus halosaccharovorans TaxID=930124 RepID=A0ABT3DNX4_9BACI|nr:ABC transporter substrate-binding protein [Metabacillus halosaccharovorans]MCV9888763.1 ABC transporter substrate-binding protein [Metabacillus halosaccharovorans]
MIRSIKRKMERNNKKKMSIVLALGLSASLALTGCSSSESGKESKETAVAFNESGLPIVEEEVTLNFVSPKQPLAPDYSEMVIFDRLQEATNVSIKWNNIPGDGYQEKKNLLLASGDLPDAFYASGFTDQDLMQHGQSGTIIPLEDLIDKYAPNLKKLFEERPELKQIVTAPDGHIYSLPRAEEMDLVGMPNIMFINQTWLDKLGLEMPTTLEEYHDVLKAFKEKDPNGNGKQDEIGLTFWFNGWCGNEGDLIGLFGLPDAPFEADHRIVRDGKVIYAATQPEFKEAIAYYHQWVKEGLIDPEVVTQDTAQLFAKGKTEDPTLGSFIWWEDTEVVGTDRVDDYAILPPLKGKDGEVVVGRSNYSEYGRDAFVITSANENPEITMRWADQLYEPKMSAQINWGPIGEIYEEDENGMLVNKELPEGVAMGELRQKVAPGGPFVVLKEHFGTVVDMEPRAKERLDILEKYYKPHMVEENYPQIFFSAEELEKINTIEPEIKEFVKQKEAQWLVEGGIEEEWDEYVEQLEAMGLNELMEVYQTGLDRFNKEL